MSSEKPMNETLQVSRGSTGEFLGASVVQMLKWRGCAVVCSRMTMISC
ncbi:hypothetical protein CPTC_01418 [Corynebacterium pseudotuberculosis]|nr:hypothetical protein CPTA_01428 [Corynebacterium pseudotuberculosis]AIG11706.1 hypothetical protein CPTC_01418 [Corynebacterium pseudotuberculosis]